jgi:hypothetical protein
MGATGSIVRCRLNTPQGMSWGRRPSPAEIHQRPIDRKSNLESGVANRVCCYINESLLRRLPVTEPA